MTKQMAEREIIFVASNGERAYWIERVGAGLEVAGAGLRETDGYYAARNADAVGAIPSYGRQFKTEAEARDLMNRWLGR